MATTGGGAVIPSVSDRLRRERPVSYETSADTMHTADESLLTSLCDMHRITKAGVKFNQLSYAERKQFYKEAVDRVLNCPTGNLTAFDGACRIAMMYDIVIADCDRGNMKSTINTA